MYKNNSFDASVEFRPGAFDEQEAFDIELMENFFKSFPKTFSEYIPMPSGYIFDAMASSASSNIKTHRFYAIENKEREVDFDVKYKDCFIETSKYKNLRELSENNKDIIPLYINYKGDDATKVYVWDLTKELTHPFYPKVYIKDMSEPQQRYGLQWNECTVFEKDENGKYKVIQKPDLLENTEAN